MARSRSYSEALRFKTIQERYEYLRLGADVGSATFGFDRYINQRFYGSKEWRDARNKVIVRDGGWDLGIEGYPCGYTPTVHHINPVTLDQLDDGDPALFDPDNLILCSCDTHRAIHYGPTKLVTQEVIERTPWDTCPWRKPG